jgi:hypothetical protein
MKAIVAAIAGCLLSVSSFAQSRIGHAEALPSVTLSALDPLVADSTRMPRMHSHPRKPLDLWLERSFDSDVALPSAAPSISPPPMTASFAAINEAEGLWSPPDATGAVGRSQIVAVTNGGIVVQSRAGERLAKIPLYTFMGVAINDTRDLYYDPRVVYDGLSDRWVITCIRDEQDLMIAVSQTGDALGEWYRYRVRDTDLAASSLDFMQLALTTDKIVIGTNDYGYSFQLISIQKSDAYERRWPLLFKTTLFGNTDVVPVSNDETGTAYFLIGLQYVGRLDGNLVQIRIPQPCCPPPTGAPQKGTTEHVDTGSVNAQSAMYRNGFVYVAGAITIGNPKRESIQWAKIDPNSGAIADSGIVDDPTGDTWYGYPSMAVNRSGAMVIGFATFSPNRYPSAGYAYRDALGRVSTAGTIRNGNTPYLHAHDFNGQRWGDYTATVVDPVKDTAFWTLQIVSLDTFWETWWARFETSPASSRHRAVRK